MSKSLHKGCPPDAPVLNIREASSLLRLSRASIYRLTRKKAIPYVQISGAIRFRRDGLMDWLRRNERPATEATTARE